MFPCLRKPCAAPPWPALVALSHALCPLLPCTPCLPKPCPPPPPAPALSDGTKFYILLSALPPCLLQELVLDPLQMPMRGLIMVVLAFIHLAGDKLDEGVPSQGWRHERRVCVGMEVGCAPACHVQGSMNDAYNMESIGLTE